MFPNNPPQPPENGRGQTQQPQEQGFIIATALGPVMIPCPPPGPGSMPQPPALAQPPNAQPQQWMHIPPNPVQGNNVAPSQQHSEPPSHPKVLLLAPLPKPTQDPNNPATLPSDYYTYRDTGCSEEELEQMRKKRNAGK